MTEIYRDTPMAKAIFEMFDNLADFLEDWGASLVTVRRIFSAGVLSTSILTLVVAVTWILNSKRWKGSQRGYFMNSLLNVAYKGLDHVTDQEVVKAALEVWHQGYVPTLSGLPLEARRLAGYLVDPLSRFNCLSAEKKKELQTVGSDASAGLSVV